MNSKPGFFQREVLIGFLGVSLSIFCFASTYYSQQKSIQTSFERLVHEQGAAFYENVEDNLDAMGSLQAFYASSNFVDREEFRTFSQNILSRFKGIQALEWIPVIKHQDRASFEQEISSELGLEFHIKEFISPKEFSLAQEREVYFPALYIEPFEGNQKILGVDMASETRRKETLEKAQNTGEAMMSAPIDLARETEERKGFLMLAPIYKDEKAGGALHGFLLVALRLHEVLRPFLANTQTVMRFNLSDVTVSSNPESLYSSYETSELKKGFLGHLASNFTVKTTFRIAGRQWELHCIPSQAWLREQDFWQPWGILIFGLLITGILISYLRGLITRSQHFEHAVEERTAKLDHMNLQLRVSEEKFRSLVANVPGAIYRCQADKMWTMEFLSDAIFEFSGYPADEFLQNKIRSFASIIHSEDASMVEKIVGEGIEKKKPYVLEYRIQHASGEIRWVYEKGQGVFSDEGKLLFLDGVIFDATERRKLGDQAAQSQKMEAIGKLAGGLAHDFNNQLMVITGYSDFLLKEISPDDFKHTEVQEIKNAADKASKLTRQLLAFGRRQIIAPKVFNINRLVEDLQKVFKSLAGESVTLETDLYQPEKKGQDSVCLVKADIGQMEQVLLNLAVNARDAMPNGGVLKIVTKPIKFSARIPCPYPEMPAVEYVLLEVSDNGMGMTEEVKKHLFEPFFTTKEKGKGTGLGLATCYGIIRSSSGYIQITSQVGQGTSIKIYLPLCWEKEDGINAQKKSKELPQGNETILVVEDETSVRYVAASLLRNQGYQVLEAESSEKAIEFLDKNPEQKIDLILTDVILPQMSGRELMDAVKVKRPQTKFLFMSGYTDDVILRHGISSSEINFLQKPFASAGLGFKVREVMDKK